ncbi:hypothetical protein IM792_16135 [Mucilaginibacter sp. JRF]|uniref:PulJ/GspJ family protein n=1 Tax=Mucilaginibacter sp. JRF TaxID=2780088 RepID=UPI0018823D40|nr:hypothetical protein [Mucilaginibacter sp. JRF]MBE9585984.1 hypothetical protein [Mucilaginibacter sp. JRF]
MAGKKIKLNTRVSGSSLMEVLVAMILLLIVFGIAMMIFANIARTSVNTLELQARSFAEKELEHVKIERSFTPEQTETDSMTINREVSFLPKQPGMVEVNIRVTDRQQKQLAEIKEQIRADETH